MIEPGHYKPRSKSPKYSPEQILWWRQRIKEGIKMGDLAKEIGISGPRLSMILSKDAYGE